MLLITAISAALATDYEREVRPGITSFKRFTSGADPQNVFAVGVDLSVPNVGVYASADRRGDEWYTDTLSFAEEVGAIAAINGDWSCTTCSGNDYLAPLGLAISGGVVWNDHIQTDTIGSRWGYIACTLDKRCDLAVAEPLGDEDMFFSSLQAPTVYPLRYHDAIGANGIILIDDGVAETACYDTSSTNPRSAACIQADGIHLWLVVVDGRGAGGGTGMSCNDMRDLLLTDPFLCWDAVMLDGGGSSTLVVEDTNAGADCNPSGDNDLCVKNNPSDGSPRTVANHLGITWEDVADTRCVVTNGRWCAGTSMHTCQGGRYRGSDDCADGGDLCQEDGDYAFCVDPRCPGGDGLRRYACVDATQIAGCNDGEYAVGDCGVWGLVCGEDSLGGACMDSRCTSGPNSSFCLSDTSLAACTVGVYAESSCDAGTSCVAGVCVAPGNDTGPGTGTGTETDTIPSEDSLSETYVRPPGESVTNPGSGGTPGDLVGPDEAGCGGGCSAGQAARSWSSLLVLLMLPTVGASWLTRRRGA